MSRRITKKHIVLLSVAALLVALIIAGAVYVGTYYRATPSAVAAMQDGASPAVTVQTIEKNATAFIPADPVAGLIFYPGGKVEHTAYAPLMQALAARGVLCVLVEMPFRLAALDANAADVFFDDLRADYPAVADWYIGGHSLGGTFAATWAEKHQDELAGLILLASYTTADLSESNLHALSIYGSEDRVLNAEKYASATANLPSNYVEEILEGGNHAEFGDYGPQKGDGQSALGAGEQIRLSADIIASFVTP